ncbi:MAG: outer membrane lipoprotein carrier protein LolA [Thermodesulfobacteriota bacterium]
MKSFLVLIFGSLCLCGEIFCPFITRADEGRLLEQAEAQDVLQRIKESQADLTTITASFVEERRIAVLANPLVFSGKVYVEPEDFLFLQYEKPLRHIMKMAGDSVLFFVEDSETADMVDLAGAQERGQRPDLFNWSPKNFQGEVREVKDGYLLVDPNASAGSRQVRVVVDKSTLVVRHILLVDESGDETRITLSDVRLNEEISEHIRNYALPQGVRVHKLNQP